MPKFELNLVPNFHRFKRPCGKPVGKRLSQTLMEALLLIGVVAVGASFVMLRDYAPPAFVDRLLIGAPGY
jgi:hypothetical protein